MNIDGLDEFLSVLTELDQSLEGKAAEWLEALGMTFLDEIQNEIIRMEVVDTRRLLTSFNKGDNDNVWRLIESKLELEIGSNLEYARLVNDGHLTARGQHPDWHGPQRWVEGRPYFDVAFAIFERMFQKALRNKLAEFLEGGK